MGKIRVKALGDETLEQQQQEEARARKEAKKTEKKESLTDSVSSAESPVEKKTKKEKFQPVKGPKHSKSYNEKAALVEKRLYDLTEAIALLPQLKRAKFDETVEIHITTTETGISGSVTLPHGTGKQVRVTIANGSDQAEIETLLKKIESGNIDFDILIATPDAMPKLARAAKILGPRGLMPNPKNGTVSPTPDVVANKFLGGQINFKTEAKFPLLHAAVGKVSFDESKIQENIKTFIAALDRKKIKNVTLKSTMSPAIHLNMASL